jgi:hypothetical protein
LICDSVRGCTLPGQLGQGTPSDKAYSKINIVFVPTSHLLAAVAETGDIAETKASTTVSTVAFGLVRILHCIFASTLSLILCSAHRISDFSAISRRLADLQF